MGGRPRLLYAARMPLPRRAPGFLHPRASYPLAGIVSAVAGFTILCAGAFAQPTPRWDGAPTAVVTPIGGPQTVFDPKTDACDGHDVPDAPARAFRGADGGVVMFGMHYVNRALRGPTLDALKLDCKVVLASGGKDDPAAYDDYSWITATWTDDGVHVAALVHHEYHANEHKGRCAFPDMMRCWTNSILVARSSDAGSSFTRPDGSPVLATYPFPQDVGQGRHRGFFNPSNIVSDGEWKYMFAATTGWTGQRYGACLFRTRTPSDPRSWLAWDGRAFAARTGDPYAGDADPTKTCEPIAPFVTPVGAIVRHRPSGAWIAVMMASKNDSFFTEPGFWATASRDLIHWSKPTLVMSGATLYDDPCKAGSRLIAYPSLLDPAATTRNFEDAGDDAMLYYVSMRVDGCSITSDRTLLRRRVKLSVLD